MSLRGRQLYRFGAYRLDATDRLLYRHDQLVALPPKVFDTLLLLVTNSGRVVAKDEMVKQLWPDTFVEEGTLSQYISQLRKALGDCGNWIENLPRRGYRFTAPVEALAEDITELHIEEHTRSRTVTEEEVLTSKERGSRLWIVATALALGLALWFLYSLLRPSADRALVEFSVFPPKGTTFPPGGPGPAVSPDGRNLAFVAVRPNGDEQIWVRPLDSSTARPLQGTQGAMRPFWSPDSRSIAYFANGRLWRVELDSGATRDLCEAPYFGGLSGAWGEKDVILFPKRGGLYRVGADGGPAGIVVTDTQETKPHAPNFLPGGRHFLYLAWSPRPERNQICVASLDSSETSCLASLRPPFKYAAPGYLLLIEDSALVTQTFNPRRLAVSGEPVRIPGIQAAPGAPYLPPQLSVSRNGVLAFVSRGISPLVWLDRSGIQLEALGTGSEPAVSRDGRRIVVVRRDLHTGNTDLWLYDRTRGSESRFTFDPSNESAPVFSPDAEHVLFVSDRSGSGQLFIKPTSGAGDEKLVASTLTNVYSPPDWSSDGKFVLCQILNFKTMFDLWAVPLADDHKPFAVGRTEHAERFGRFSPDVRWVAYDSTESGRREVWVQPFPPTGSKWQISTNGGSGPSWRGDGKELFYLAAHGMLTAVPTETNQTFKSGAPRPLFQTMFRGGVSAPYAVSHDGKRFLMNVPPGVDDVTPITVVMNWTALLQK
jgi:DNA-binding winged helix-turn-helix (wHTH) protein/Tol biopolymer transport system component